MKSASASYFVKASEIFTAAMHPSSTARAYML